MRKSRNEECRRGRQEYSKLWDTPIFAESTDVLCEHNLVWNRHPGKIRMCFCLRELIYLFFHRRPNGYFESLIGQHSGKSHPLCFYLFLVVNDIYPVLLVSIVICPGPISKSVAVYDTPIMVFKKVGHPIYFTSYRLCFQPPVKIAQPMRL